MKVMKRRMKWRWRMSDGDSDYVGWTYNRRCKEAKGRADGEGGSKIRKEEGK